MNKSISVLISSAGRRGQLVDCFRESAQALGIPLRVLAADVRPKLSAACQIADAAFGVPPCNSTEFIPALREICEREGVRIVVPTIDPELAVWSKHRESFAAIGTSVAVSDLPVVGLAGDKQRTAVALSEAGIRTPQTMSAAEFVAAPAQLRWPVILKPRGGSSSVGILRPQSRDEAIQHARQAHDLIVQELWSGREYTVNLFFDRTGTLRCAVPHWRIETRTGEVSKGRTEDLAVLRDAARKLPACLPGARGALCFQAIVTESGEYAIFEINARFGGGYPLAHRAGATFTKWLLEEVLGLPPTAADRWEPGITMLRYDTAVFRRD